MHTTLPALPIEPLLYPQTILDQRMVKKNQVAIQMLIHWMSLTPIEAT
jgi:hypothetical protein